MFSHEHMQELVTYEGNGSGVVSVYLDTDSTRQSVEAIKLTARGLLKEVQPQHDKDAQAIARFLDLSYDWSKPGLALFCSKGGEFFRAYDSPESEYAAIAANRSDAAVATAETALAENQP